MIVLSPRPQRLFHDFETYSDLDVRKVGSSPYARHPSTEVIMCAYAFDDGPVKQWVPVEGEIRPAELEDAIQDDRILKSAWNKPFEWNIWKHCEGIETPHRAWRDTMVMALALSFPGALDKAGKAIGLDEKYLKKDGTNLINWFSRLRPATKLKPIRRAHWYDKLDKWLKYLEYNRADVIAERKIYRMLRRYDLPEHEWEMWALDQEINEDGIPVNIEMARNAIDIHGEIVARRLDEMKAITRLQNPNAQGQLLGWLQFEGYPYVDLKRGHVRRALEDYEGGNPNYCRVLELRLEASRTAPKKFKALEQRTDDDGRLRYALQFAAAGRTWRWGGRGYQVHNLAKPEKWLEDIEWETTPLGFQRAIGGAQVVAAEAVEKLDADCLEILYSKPMDVLAACTRPVIQAPPGYVFIDADLNAIENRVLGWLADDRRILRVFEQGRDPYVDFATYLYGQTYEALWAEYKAGRKAKRTVAKPGVLGCPTGGTLVLTDSGWKRLDAVTTTDLVHDGVGWVGHDGVVNQGLQECVEIGGVKITPDHKVLMKEGDWRCIVDLDCLSWSRAIGSARLLLSGTSRIDRLLDKFTNVDAVADAWASRGDPASSNQIVRPRGASTVRDGFGLSFGGWSAVTFSICSRIVSTQSDRDARTRTMPGFGTMGRAACAATLHPLMSSWSTSLANSVRTGRWKSTESITTAITRRGIFAWPIAAFRTAIETTATASSIVVAGTAQPSFVGSSRRSIVTIRQWLVKLGKGFQRRKSSQIRRLAGVHTVYDVLNAGPRNRFVILSEDGPLIIHNCGYLLGPGKQYEDRQSGEIEATGLLGYAWNMGVRLTPEESERSVQVWRATFRDAVQFWWDISDAAFDCLRRGCRAGARHVAFERDGPFLKMVLPSARSLYYYQPKIEDRLAPWGDMKPSITYMQLNDKHQWDRVSTHPGKLTENADQAVARDLLAHGIRLAWREGVKVVFHVHDQVVALVRESEADEKLRLLIDCMSERPEWAKGLPMAAAGHISKWFLKE